MQINKISVGVETLQNPLEIPVISKSKIKKVSELFILVSGKTKVSVIKLLLAVKRLLNFIPAHMRRDKKNEGDADSGGIGHENKLKPNILKKYKKGVILTTSLILLVAVAAVTKVKPFSLFNSNNGSTATSGNQVEVKNALKNTDVNAEFQFPVKDAKGNEVTKFKYLIEKAELRDEIIVKGQKATAVKGRVFLIVYLRLTNEYSSKLDINTRNYTRLSLNGNENEWLAPDIHNDPVEVQAQSTKVTRLGFPIYESDSKLLLRIGEIDGQKEKVELNFD